jgi:hypothetical protein
LGFIPLALIYLDIFLIKGFFSLEFVFFILVWIVYLWKMKIEAWINFLVAFALIVIWVFLIFFGIGGSEYKLNIWVYTFLVIGCLAEVLEEKNRKTK